MKNDLEKSRTLMRERDHHLLRTDEENHLTHLGLADEVPGLVKEVEDLREQATNQAEAIGNVQKANLQMLAERNALRETKRDLLSALGALGVQGEPGYCFCLSVKQVEAGHVGECREAQAAIARAKEGGA